MKGPDGGGKFTRQFPYRSLGSSARAKFSRGGLGLSRTSAWNLGRTVTRGQSPRSKVLAHKKLIRHSRPWSRMKGAAGPQYLPTDQEAVGKHGGRVNTVKWQLFPFFFLFFHFLSLLTAAFLKRKKTAAGAAKPCLLEGKERGGGSRLSSGLRRARAERRPTAVSSAAP